MMIYMMQHGEAVTETVDPDRPLSDSGRSQIEASAFAAKTLGIEPDAILCSSKKRARQTAELLAAALNFPADNIIETDTLKPSSPPEEALDYLAALTEKESVLIAGHLPSLARIASALLTPTSDLFIQIENGGLICIDAPAVPPEDMGGTLRYYLPPNVLLQVNGATNTG